nr:sulfotransferase 1C4-like [Cherax quadricarinatus]
MSKLVSGHEVVVMSDEWLARLGKEQQLYKEGMVKLMPDGWLLPAAFTRIADKIYNFKLRPSDVILMGMPKSGTTWLQEVLWTMLNNPDLNNDKADTPTPMRSPQIEFDALADSNAWDKMMVDFGELPQSFQDMAAEFLFKEMKSEDGVFLKMSEALPDRRVMKTHLPFCLLPPYLLNSAKVVYAVRNPKDVVVSLYHHFKNFQFHSYTGTFDNFVKLFMEDDLLFSPLLAPLGSSWKMKDQPSVVEHTSFSSMKSRLVEFEGKAFKSDAEKNEGFFRKGVIGDWKNHFSPELEKQMNHWIENNTANTNIIFKGN